jgi:hypothetical protein
VLEWSNAPFLFHTLLEKIKDRKFVSFEFSISVPRVQPTFEKTHSLTDTFILVLTPTSFFKKDFHFPLLRNKKKMNLALEQLFEKSIQIVSSIIRKRLLESQQQTNISVPITTESMMIQLTWSDRSETFAQRLVDVVVEMASNWLTSPKERMMLQSVLNNFLLVTAPVSSPSSREDNVKNKVPKECDLDELIKSTRLQDALKDSFMRAVHELTATNEATSRTSAKGSRKRKHTPKVPPPAAPEVEPPVSSFLKEEVVDQVETVDDRQDIAGKPFS